MSEIPEFLLPWQPILTFILCTKLAVFYSVFLFIWITFLVVSEVWGRLSKSKMMDSSEENEIDLQVFTSRNFEGDLSL